MLKNLVWDKEEVDRYVSGLALRMRGGKGACVRLLYFDEGARRAFRTVNCLEYGA